MPIPRYFLPTAHSFSLLLPDSDERETDQTRRPTDRPADRHLETACSYVAILDQCLGAIDVVYPHASIFLGHDAVCVSIQCKAQLNASRLP